MTTRNRTRVAVNGYGVIGKRIADAVRLQPDMELVGVADVVADYRIQTAALQGVPVYASTPEGAKAMRAAGVPVAGELDALLERVDVVADCTPKGVGANNLERYRRAGVKAALQGGEKHDVTGHSFVAQANYASAVGRDFTRVVSCNTTSTVRTLGALHAAGLLKKARGVLVRRATDPWESDHSGIMNTVVPERVIPSHQGPDARTVMPELDVVTIAAKAAHTQGHGHFWIVELTREAHASEVLDAFRAAPRIALMRTADGMIAPSCAARAGPRAGRTSSPSKATSSTTPTRSTTRPSWCPKPSTPCAPSPPPPTPANRCASPTRPSASPTTSSGPKRAHSRPPEPAAAQPPPAHTTITREEDP